MVEKTPNIPYNTEISTYREEKEMEALYIIIGIMVVFLIQSIYMYTVQQKMTKNKIKEAWGKLSDEEYTSEKFQSLQCYFREHFNEKTDVDDITWNDFDMDTIYMMINTTKSSLGEEYLYALLRQLCFDEAKLKERDELIEYFKSHKEERLKLQLFFDRIGKNNKISVYEYINRLNELGERDSFKHYISLFGMLFSIGAVFFDISTGISLILCFVVYNIYSYYKEKAKIEHYISVFSLILRMLKASDELGDMKDETLQPYIEKIQRAAKEFSGFRRGAGIVAKANATGDVTDIILDYIRMLFHVDFIKFNSMLKQVRGKREKLNDIFETLGFLDSMIAISSFRVFLRGDYCKPELYHDKNPYLSVKNVYHPMIANPVKSSLTQSRSVLITGSNASGKSTFLRTLGVNAILSQTIYTSLSESYHATYFKVISSMSLQDSLETNESYYIVEIKSLKRIMDQMNDSVPTLCFVDEVLRGTNTLERIAASSEILMSFAKSNTICFAATHDIELTHILENYYSNYHFQEEVTDTDVIFNYELYKGRATSKNAINLLKIIGYDNHIIEAARNKANLFLENGTWDVVQ